MRGSELMLPDLRLQWLLWVLEVCKRIPVTCCHWDQVGEGSVDTGSTLFWVIWDAKQIVFGLHFAILSTVLKLTLQHIHNLDNQLS